MKLDTIDSAIAAIAAGQPVIVADDEDRENEGDLILSAQLATTETIAFMVEHSSGLLCAPMSDEIADRLELPMMVTNNQDVRQTAYTVTVDAAEGVTTGISAADRAHTVNLLAGEHTTPSDLNRPGHILPLRAVGGGVRQRPGHTEAAVELMRLAGLAPVGVIAEIVADDGDMMRLPGLIEMGAEQNIPVITIEALIHYLNAHHPETAPDKITHRHVSQRAEALVPTDFGPLTMKVYRDRKAGVEHLALIGPNTTLRTEEPTVVRVHSECLTGEAFGSQKCECGAQLDASLEYIGTHGGIVIYLRGHEGRGIGLGNKIRAYQLQSTGLDTIEANEHLGLPIDARSYTAAAEILDSLGIHNVKLMTNNPDKVTQLEANGITVTERIGLVVGQHPENLGYLTTKATKLDHAIPTENL
ncbi:3,4-dihydroxy-2-butanone-4-phosphate synthase [Enteractinococcus coprophilus]|uniref:GTP cyclohydrolase-2 n=1 Tax=Enteractinococcus coprophilus TaxID=1027633 RepID=A0A543AJR7_9MICC|nr:3,4-dihydroxy-2-butanone-4-phosphate synthase [Enteractinococcus coprophilus]TQL72820.1 GTP cyclohydrolase II /3,4-dihydroxy-2-butanone 4-phosphate synthase [Enteractinococcus coprophilus]